MYQNLVLHYQIHNRQQDMGTIMNFEENKFNSFALHYIGILRTLLRKILEINFEGYSELLMQNKKLREQKPFKIYFLINTLIW